MKLRGKFSLVVFTSITLLVLFSSYFFVVSYINVEKAYALQTQLANNQKISEMLLEVGKERGLTALWMAQREDTKRSTQHHHQIKQSDKALKAHTTLTIKHPILFGKINLLDTATYTSLEQNIGKLSLLRTEISKPNTPFQEIFFGYQYTLSTPMMDILLQLHHFTLNQEITSLILPLTQLYISKEHSDLQRSFLGYYLSKKEALSKEDLILWERLRSKANSFDITQVTDPILQQQINTLLNKKAISTLITTLQENAANIHTEILTGMYEQEGLEWFTLQTQKITLLSQVEALIFTTLNKRTQRYLRQQQLFLSISAFIWLLSFVLAFVGYSIVRRLTKEIKCLQHVNTLNRKKEQTNPTPQTPPPTPTPKKILIVKKISLEQRILAQAIQTLGYAYDILETGTPLLPSLQTGEYGTLFIDRESVTREILQLSDLQIITQQIDAKEQLEKYLQGMAKY